MIIIRLTQEAIVNQVLYFTCRKPRHIIALCLGRAAVSSVMFSAGNEGQGGSLASSNLTCRHVGDGHDGPWHRPGDPRQRDYRIQVDPPLAHGRPPGQQAPRRTTQNHVSRGGRGHQSRGGTEAPEDRRGHRSLTPSLLQPAHDSATPPGGRGSTLRSHGERASNEVQQRTQTWVCPGILAVHPRLLEDRHFQRRENVHSRKAQQRQSTQIILRL